MLRLKKKENPARKSNKYYANNKKYRYLVNICIFCVLFKITNYVVGIQIKFVLV